MALFSWLQKWIKYLFGWLGYINTEDSNWNDLSTQLNLLNDQIVGVNYFTAKDKEIQSLPIDSFIVFPKKFWIFEGRYRCSVVDESLYLKKERPEGGAGVKGTSFYYTNDLVNFNPINSTSIFIDSDSYINQYIGLDYHVKTIKRGDFYYTSRGRYGLNSEGRIISEYYSEIYSSGVQLCYCQTLYRDDLIQLVLGSNFTASATSSFFIESDVLINGVSSSMHIPISSGGRDLTAYCNGSITTYYNSLPNMILRNVEASDYGRYIKYDLESGNYLYIMNGDLLYVYDNYVMETIYHIPFVNYGMFYMNGSLYFRVQTGAIKCNLN